MITHKENSENPPSFELLGIVEHMINTYNLSERQKTAFRKRLNTLSTQDQLESLYAEIAPHKPIMGLEAIPLDVRQQVEATRWRVDLENFKERQWKEY